MRAEELSRLLVVDDWERRDYLGMSQIGSCPRWLYASLVDGNGHRPTRRVLLAMHEGQVHQADILERLERAGVRVTNRGRELVGFDERLRGHVLGEVDGDVLLIKTLPDWDALNQVMEHGPRPRDRDQMQLYMRYGGYQRGLIVYKERRGGEVWVCWVTRDEQRGRELEEKAEGILAAVDGGQLPRCTCGRCDGCG